MDGKYKRREQEVSTALDRLTGFPGIFHDFQRPADFSSDRSRAELYVELKDIKAGRHKDDYALRKLDTWIYFSLEKQKPQATKPPTGKTSKFKPGFKGDRQSVYEVKDKMKQGKKDEGRNGSSSPMEKSGANKFKSESNLVELQPTGDKKPRRLRWGKKNKKKYADTVSLYTFDEMMMAKKDTADSRSMSELERAANKYGTLPRNKFKAFFSKSTINRIKLGSHGSSNNSEDKKNKKKQDADSNSPTISRDGKGNTERVRVNATYTTPSGTMKKRGDLFAVEKSFFQMSMDGKDNGTSYEGNQRQNTSQSNDKDKHFVIMRETSLHNGATVSGGSPRDSMRGRPDNKKLLTSQGHPIFYLPSTKKTELGEI